jgi:16S rRNA G966 N2-methylase RsmD
VAHLIELCAGTASVSFAALGCSRFPVSRIGSKQGWTAPILDAVGVHIDVVTLVEADARLAALLAAMTSTSERFTMARAIEASLADDSRAVWERARSGPLPVDTLLWMAGARGGIGGYKGAHKLRPSVDGFIPSRASLARRLRTFVMAGSVTVLCADASTLDPWSFAPTVVYLDPPYAGRQGYRAALAEPAEALAGRWRDAGHRVVVSEARPLAGADETREITSLRRGQSRRSLTTDHSEWLSLYEPNRA